LAEVSFGEWLRRQRKAGGLTQQELALRLSCSARALKKFEAEQRRPSPPIVERLADHFNIPAGERAAFQRFARGDWAAAPAMRPPAGPWRAPRPAPPTDVPIPLTSFIGRKREVADVVRLVNQHRLVTLTGPGGVGKTRLAIESSGRLLGKFDDGVCWVELAALTDESLIPQAVAKALGAREIPNQSLLEILSDFLRSRQLLLVLDNCEHLIGGCARLAYDLLTRCATLKILATSREVLDITGEQAYQVPTLSLPRPEQLSLAGLLLEYESIRLFVERARARSGFRITEDNAAAVLQICRRLDGIPLALELAAARTPQLAAEHIAERLNDRFNLLTHGSRAALPRQQTLRATLAWSYDLLSENEQALFRRLAVFSGGWTLAAAQAVCAGEGFEPAADFDLLADLARKTLLSVPVGEGEPRYQMLETIGEYAREKLAEAAETERVSARHRDWFLQLAEDVKRDGRETSSRLQLDQLAREHDNFRAALNWSLRQGQVAKALRLTYKLADFWVIRDHWNEGRAWIERALKSAGFDAERPSPAPSTLWAQALCSLGRLAIAQRDVVAAQSVLEKCVGLYRSLSQSQGLSDAEHEDLALALNNLGFAAYYQGSYARAAALYEEALALYQASGNIVGIGFTLTNLARVANWQGQYGRAARLGEESAALGRKLEHVHLIAAALDVTGRALAGQCDFDRARSLLEESLALSRELDFQQDIADILNVLGLVEFYRGDNGRSAALFEEALALSQALNYSMGRAGALSGQAEIALAQADPARARPLLAESLAAFRQLGMKLNLIRCLEIEAAGDAAECHPARAARLFAAAAAAREALGAPLPPPDRPAYDRALTQTRTHLGPQAFATAYQTGLHLTLDQAIDDALEVSTL
jgi:non-specific serine/threonine protein kinase